MNRQTIYAQLLKGPPNSGDAVHWPEKQALKAEITPKNDIDTIRERIRLGFYNAQDVDTDISDKLARAFFELEQ